MFIIITLGVVAWIVYEEGAENVYNALQCRYGKQKVGGCERPFYIIAHMTNTLAAVDAAIDAGANAIEADLVFHSDTSNPDRFYHGSPCDCTCRVAYIRENICTDEDGLGCDEATDAVDFLTGLRTRDLAMVVIDSKIDNHPDLDLSKAGEKIAEDVWKYTFGGSDEEGGSEDSTFQGFVVIGMAYVDTRDYLAAAYGWVEEHYPPWARKRTLFSIDGESDSYAVEATFNEIGVETHRRLYGSGISSCAPNPFTRCLEHVGDSTDIRQKGGFAGVYSWTVDISGDQLDCVTYGGVDGVITNLPKRLRKHAVKYRKLAEKSYNEYFTGDRVSNDDDDGNDE